MKSRRKMSFLTALLSGVLTIAMGNTASAQPTMSSGADYSGSVSAVNLTDSGSGPWNLSGTATFEYEVAASSMVSYDFQTSVELEDEDSAVLWSDSREETLAPGSSKSYAMGNGSPGTEVTESGLYTFSAYLRVKSGILWEIFDSDLEQNSI